MLEKNICFGRIPPLFISQSKNQCSVLSLGNSILINLAQMCMHKTTIDFMIPLALWRDKKIGHRLNSYNFIEKEVFNYYFVFRDYLKVDPKKVYSFNQHLLSI